MARNFIEIAERELMVECQVKPFGVNDRQVLEAMGKVSRGAFVVDEQARAFAYLDGGTTLLGEAGRRSLSPPATFARLLQEARLRGGEKVCVVGCGTGYPLAVLHAMGLEASGCESDADLVRAAPGAFQAAGFPPLEIVHAPLDAGLDAQDRRFDLLLFDGAIDEVPEPWMKHLAPEGRVAGLIASDAGFARAFIDYTFAGTVSRVWLFEALAPTLMTSSRPPAFHFA